MGADGRARLRAVPDTDTRHPSLPWYPTELIGREQALAAVVEAAESRVVTLTGVGGVGKTRLAVAAAEALAGRFDGSVLFVSLRHVTDAEAVCAAIATAAGWHVADESRADEAVIAQLAQRPVLVVLDNVEQIERVADPIAHLAVTCPAVWFLITSRRAIGLSYETVLEIGPLAPGPAGDLLAQATRTHDPTFAVTPGQAAAVTELCTRLDGLPLVLELAAARLRLLTPTDLVGLLDERLAVLGTGDEGAGHHTSLRAAIDWSYRLLTPDDQRRFRALSVFPDTFALDAAAAVCGDAAVSLADTLTTLVDHHLVGVTDRSDGPSRFSVLESLRQFARAELDEHGESPLVTGRLIGWVVGLAERVRDDITAGHGRDASSPLERDLPALRTALAAAHSIGDPAPAIRVIAATWPWWPAVGRVREAIAYLDSAVAMVDAGANVAPAYLADALRGRAELALAVGDAAHAQRFAARSIDMYGELGDEARLSRSLYTLGWALSTAGEMEPAEVAHRQQLDIARRLQLDVDEAQALSGLARIAFERRDHRTAATYFERAYDVYGSAGRHRAQAATATNVGVAYAIGGDHARAAEAYSRAIAIAAEIGDRVVVAHASANRGEALTELGRYDEADADFANALDEAARTGAPWVTSIAIQNRGVLHQRRGLLGRAALDFAGATAGHHTLSRLFDAIGAAEQLAAVAVELGETDVAARIAAVTRAARAASGTSALGELELEVTYIDEYGPVDDWKAALTALVPDMEGFAAAHADAVRAEADDPLAALGLSVREAEVARLVAARRTDAEIAAELFISQHTAVSHVAAVRRKLGVRSRRDVAGRLAELGAELTA